MLIANEPRHSDYELPPSRDGTCPVPRKSKRKFGEHETQRAGTYWQNDSLSLQAVAYSSLAAAVRCKS